MDKLEERLKQMILYTGEIGSLRAYLQVLISKHGRQAKVADLEKYKKISKEFVINDN